MSFEPIVLK
jgi:hypothetical protein